MRRAMILVVCVAMAVLMAPPAAADWNVGDPFKMHEPQLPDPEGWDVLNTNNPIFQPPLITFLADDWRCTETGEVNEIHIWGSWRGDIQAMVNVIRIQIHADDRTGPFSKPEADPLWFFDFQQGQFTERFYERGNQGWFDPNTGEFIPFDHANTWQYNITNIEEFTQPFVQTAGQIYWLVVIFDVPDDSGVAQYGWKTSTVHFEDAAVWSDDRISWQPLSDPETGGLLDLAFVINGRPVDVLDFGDAPDGAAAAGYPTLLASNGARHTIDHAVFLGAAVDPEPDGQPNAAATGDDLAGIPDDEDGVVFTTALAPGAVAGVDVTASAPGLLDAWIDFNNDSDWIDPGEQIFSSTALVPGVNSLNFVVPPATGGGASAFARFRFSSTGMLPPDGPAANGEVEDHMVFIDEGSLDFGDAWFDPSGTDTYQTLFASDGARHRIVTRFYLGSAVDPEGDGQPTVPADGDDLNGIPFPPGDEDGVVFTTPIIPGDPTAGVDVSAIAVGLLDAWIDFDQSCTFDPGEQSFASQLLSAGPNSLTYAVPPGASLGTTYARFRFSANGGLGPAGFAPDGEVEDYRVQVIEPLDFGDAPEAPGTSWNYPTLLASNGARHLIRPGIHLGAGVDWEPDGQPDSAALGDDLDIVFPPPNDDEDGVTFTSPTYVGWVVHIDVDAAAPGLLNAWIDYDQSGDWDPAEQIFTDIALVPGVNNLITHFPLGIPTGITFARFRFSTAAGLAPDGAAPDGEVEDYLIEIEELIDFGDAPAFTPPGGPAYPTLLAQNGARHTAAHNVRFGFTEDGEADGQPNGDATGDDIASFDDEDGVFFNTPIVAGDTAVTVDIDAAAAPAFVNAWIDFNADFDWNDPGEQIFVDLPIVTPGINTLVFAAPPHALPGPTFSRFRISSFAGLATTGYALDGEVEDYMVTIEESPFDFGDAPDTYPTLLANNGAYHQIDPDVFLGMSIDGEGDGIPDGNALGDDLFLIDDEDGVVFTPMVPNALSAVEVFASRDGLLNAWIDFDADGDWQPPEQIFADVPLLPGSNHLTFQVPVGAALGQTFARFRFSTIGGLRPDGPLAGETVPDGEVEDHPVRIAGVAELDFGDAPEIPYPTLLATWGARHVAPTNLTLGLQIDNEGDGFPTADASGDDDNGIDDEEGVSFSTTLLPGSPATVAVYATADGRLDGWIDFNADGDWLDPDDRIFNAVPVAGGAWNPLIFNVPTDAVWGFTFARFRLSSAGGLDPRGLAADGEVEDEFVFIGHDYEVVGDFGDAPDSYQTLLSSVGAWHTYSPGIFLGATVDLEHDGKPDPTATGDDLAFTDDEDGVVFVSSIVPAETATLEVIASTNGFLDAWIDFDGDGTWLAATDRIYLSEPLSAGVNNLNFSVPFGAVPGRSFARFRFSRVPGGLPFQGWAPNGEVEDYEVNIAEMRLDFGDAPDPDYPTFEVSDGARHRVPASPVYFLGDSVDDDPDGQPNAGATGDDDDGIDDEDGVRFSSCLSPGSTAEMTVVASVNGVVNAWVDFNGDGDWDDPDEHIVNDLNVFAGPSTIPFVVPIGPDIPDTFARVRFTPDQGMGGNLPTGLALDGEVEDHRVNGTGIFCDDFESADTTAWSTVVP